MTAAVAPASDSELGCPIYSIPEIANDRGLRELTRMSGDQAMNLGQKLNVKVGTKLKVVAKPSGVDLGEVVTTHSSDNGSLVFVKTLNEVEAPCGPAIKAALAD